MFIITTENPKLTEIGDSWLPWNRQLFVNLSHFFSPLVDPAAAQLFGQGRQRHVLLKWCHQKHTYRLPLIRHLNDIIVHAVLSHELT